MATIDRLAVIGSGVMGSGIAQVASYRGIAVILKDVDPRALDRGMDRARALYRKALARGRMSEADVDEKMALITATLDPHELGAADLAIEAAVEDMGVKKAVLREFEGVGAPSAIFATNTSSLSVSELASAASRPANVAGLHFFNPVHRMPLVEVIAGERTSDSTIATLVAFARRLGKIPVVVNEGPGFVVNRILGPYLNEACLLLEEGTTIEAIDAALVGFGMPMGPFRLLDEIGLDVACKVQEILGEAFRGRMKLSGILRKMYEAGRLGKKDKRGFYSYAGRHEKVDKEVYTLLAALRTGDRPASEDEIRDRLLLLMVNEGARIVAEGIVADTGAVDLAMVVGAGFPPFRGGLFRWAEHTGIAVVVAKLEECEARWGARFAPAELLRQMAGEGRS